MITLYKDDRKTTLVFHIRCENEVVPLVGARVLFDFISKATGQRIGGGECEIVDVPSGMCKYNWQEKDLSVLGDYQGRVKVELAQGATRDALTMEFKIVERP